MKPRPNFLIAYRFLIARRRAMLMSLAGIVFGVAFFIVAQAQTAGFQGFFIKTILGANGSIRIQDKFQETVSSVIARNEAGQGNFEVALREGQRYIPGIQHPQQILEAVNSFHSVIGASPVLRGTAELRNGYKTTSGRFHGIDLASYLNVSELGSQMPKEELELFGKSKEGILLGRIAADRMGIRVGDPLFVSGKSGKQYRFKLAGIFETGIEVVDKDYFYAHMEAVRRVLEEWDDVTYIQIALENPDRAGEVAAQMEPILGHAVATWQERERSWLEVFKVLRISSGITMSVIILIAGLGMFNTLAIIVMERTREIAILRSIGYTRSDILRIFLYQGMIVYFVGVVLGMAGGALLTRVIESIPLKIRGIFSTDHLVMEWAWSHYALAAVVCAVVVFLASILPARRAARIEPGNVIRGTSG